MKKILTICIFLTGTILALAQETASAWGIKFSGYVKSDIFYDTRQSSSTNGIREGHFYLYPDGFLPDADQNDINAKSSLHMLSIQTRLRGDISGPDAFGAKTSGAIEAEFFGTSESDLNGFRLRHAYVKLDWTKTSLLIGQYWHPLFPVESYPGTISFNTGAPFTPFSRNPQVRLTQKAGIAGLTFTAYTQRDFVSSGPDGSGNKYLRNSGLPGLNFQVRVPAGSLFTGWAGIDYKLLQPELRTTTNYITDEKLGSLTFFATAKLKTKPLTISMMGIYAQNATDLVMIGGYAVSEVTDILRQYKKYTNIRTGNVWLDLTTNGTKVLFGLFTGYSKNLGAPVDNIGTFYGRGSDIDYIFRVSPRATFTSGKLSFSSEFEVTTAAYGVRQSNGRVTDSSGSTNLRILLSTIYKF